MAAALALARSVPAAPPAADRRIANPTYLLELIVADLHWSTLQLGSLVLMAGACAAAGASFNLHTSRHLVYDDTKVMRLALRYCDSAGFPKSLREGLDKLYSDIGVLQGQLAPFAVVAVLSQGQRDQLQRLLPSFRRLAIFAAERLGDIEAFSRGALRPEYAADSGAIRQYLARAARGDFSELNKYGVLTPPRLKQRRQTPRIDVNRPCRVLTPTGEFDAILLDASRSGLGISSDAPLSLGLEVTVLIGGRRLEGAVLRREGAKAGLALHRSLPVDDPLFKGG